LKVYDKDGAVVSLHAMWNRRHTTKFNGVSYPVQRAAEAVYSEEGQRQVKATIDGYLANAKIIRERLGARGYKTVGGDHSPYIWVKTGKDSWEFFDKLLDEAQVVTTPGSGFGKCGAGYIRISAFNSRERVIEAMNRLEKVL
jgi:LL-diaminopimelate aminotransferase